MFYKSLFYPELYLWSILPPADEARRIHEWRIFVSKHYRCFEALKPPVHLTLHTLFKLCTSLTPDQLEYLRKWFAAQPPFSLELKNFGYFENPVHPVVFIDVMRNQHLKKLHQGIRNITGRLPVVEQGPRKSFHPHYTIGYRDLAPERFKAARQYFSEQTFSAQFPVWDVCLHRHNGNQWVLQERFPIGLNYMVQGSLGFY